LAGDYLKCQSFKEEVSSLLAMYAKIMAFVLLLTLQLRGAEQNKQIDFLSLAPSPYTHRHDSMRAGVGIYLRLKALIEEDHLPLTVAFYDVSPYLEDRKAVDSIISEADVLVIGGSTWSQGSSFYLRRFFELYGANSLLGVSASAWATAGGSHTGGEIVVEDTFRSLMGMGAQIFSLGQKLEVFTTDERIGVSPGNFTPLDCWYMDQFARSIAFAATVGGDRKKAAVVSQTLHYSPSYFYDFPKNESKLEDEYGSLQRFLNDASDPKSEAFIRMQKLISKPK
jgi:hypothetical protein